DHLGKIGALGEREMRLLHLHGPATLAPPASRCHRRRRHSVRPAYARPARVEAELFEAELEHVEQAPAAAREVAGLEEGLLLDGVEVEMLRQKVDEGLVVDATLDEARLLSGPAGAPEGAPDELRGSRPHVPA